SGPTCPARRPRRSFGTASASTTSRRRATATSGRSPFLPMIPIWRGHRRSDRADFDGAPVHRPFFPAGERRKRGLGGRLIKMAEEEGARRGCTRAVLFTVHF